MSQDSIRIAGISTDSIVDGPGLRWTLFTQGCPHHCPGCHNPATHDMSGGREATIQELIDSIKQNPLLDGITLSGGEPLVQPEACLALCSEVRKIGLNIWIYTGYTYEWIMAEGSEAQRKLIAQADVLVDGLYLEAQRSLEVLYRGSVNQRLIDVKASITTGSTVLWTPPVW